MIVEGAEGAREGANGTVGAKDGSVGASSGDGWEVAVGDRRRGGKRASWAEVLSVRGLQAFRRKVPMGSFLVLRWQRVQRTQPWRSVKSWWPWSVIARLASRWMSAGAGMGGIGARSAWARVQLSRQWASMQAFLRAVRKAYDWKRSKRATR